MSDDMVSTSKILTVSYGTFSCQLEGFDDSFDTMKAIAEYFRDLAADDRYFGAEPPTPDADMLAKIAEKEIARRVHAHEEEGQIVLRAKDTAEQDVVQIPAAIVDEIQDRAELNHTVTEAADDVSRTEIEADAAEVTVEAPEDEDEQAVEQVSSTITEADDDDSVAARLRRIRSVVAHNEEKAQDSYTEDEHAQDFLAETASDLDAALIADDAAERDLAGRGDMPKTDTFEEIDLEETIAPQPEPLANEAFDDEGENAAPIEVSQPDLDADASLEDSLSQLLGDALPEEENAVEEEDTAASDQSEAIDPEVLEDSAEPTPLRARVVKMKRTDFEAAVAAGELDDAFDIIAETTEDDEPAAAILSAEDEADLLRELAEVEAEMDSAPEVEAPAEPTEPAEAAEPRPAQLPEANDDTEVARIFDEAQSQLDTPEANAKRASIQHLRAAVAATEAEKDAGSALRPEADEDPYRSDLASVVRPRHPGDDATDPAARPRARAQRPNEQRPAPLKLVAEQRIDTPREPVRPRRVEAAQTAAGSAVLEGADHGFGAFATEIGATELPDLLEAAAAYLSDEEGLEVFSRRMLFGQVRQAEGAEFSREDTLRSFGHLLNEGKIAKIQRGRFSVTERTGFRASDRQAG